MRRYVSKILVFVAIAGVLHAQESPKQNTQAEGLVFHDRNGNGKHDTGEPGIADVRVSNGKAVARTDEEGRYTLPVSGNTILFVCKPRGWIYPTDTKNLPQFYYIHKPDGSPDDDFAYRGSNPTGPLPASVNFPLRSHEAQSKFKAVLVGDPQPKDNKEIDYFGRDIMTELTGVDAAFGITLGDMVEHDLDLLKPVNEMQSLAGIPWHTLIGNHDLNFRSPRDANANETFERVYGPADYAFQYGKVHFLVIDNVVYHGNEEGGYHAGLNKRQLSFMQNYLDTVPEEHRVVVFTHIPLTSNYSPPDPDAESPFATAQLGQMLEMLSKFNHTASFSAHTHVNAIYHLGSEFGYTPEDTDAFHIHHNLGTASGTWWKGPLDSRGIPTTPMRDGTPNGYAIATFEGVEMQVQWKAAHHEPDYQMNIAAPASISDEKLGGKEAEVVVNVFNGNDRSEVQMRVPGHSPWIGMKYKHRKDPFYTREYERDQRTPMRPEKQLHDPVTSKHIWVAPLPEGLPEGTHLIEIKAEDAYGNVYKDTRPFRVH